MRSTCIRSVLSTTAAVCLLAITPVTNFAQDSRADAPRRGLEAHVYLLVASRDGAQARLPAEIASIEPTLTSMVQLPRLSLATTFIYRTRDGGSVQASGIAGPIVAVASSATTPVFYGISIRGMRLADTGKTPTIDIGHFDFNLRVPVLTGRAGSPSDPLGPPVQYENVGSSTELRAPVGRPVVVSTIQSGKPDEVFVVVLEVRMLD